MKKLLLVFLLFQACAVFAGTPNAWDSVSWLAGCWSGAGKASSVEQWMAPAGDVMMGMRRTVQAGQPAQCEFMRIVLDSGKLTYISMPSGKPETKYALSQGTPLQAVFESASRDFPQRITYKLQPDGSLLARVEGDRNGKHEVIELPMARTQCAGEAATCSAE